MSLSLSAPPPPSDVAREERPASSSPLLGVLDARAIHVVCLGDGSPAASGAAGRACKLAVGAFKAAGRGDVTAIPVGDPRSGQPGALIVGLRLDFQPKADGLPAVVVLSGQTLRPDVAGGRTVPAKARALSTRDVMSDERLRTEVTAILSGLGVV